MGEHRDKAKMSEPARNIKSNSNHDFTFKPLHTAYSFIHRQVVEAFFVATIKSEPNKQVKSYELGSLYSLDYANSQTFKQIGRAHV